jgi:hypothetical protein
MNQREKILAIAVGGLGGLLLLGFGVRAFIVKPLREIDKRAAVIREKIGKLNAERRAFFDAEERMKAHTLRTFADTVDQASAKSGEMLTQQILKSGLTESEFTRIPVGPRKLRGAQEIGWSVQGDGQLTDVVDLLFVLEESPWMHRVENVTVSPGDKPGLVRVHFRYLTLVMDPAPEVQRRELIAKFTDASPERHLYDGIVARDILRPYIKRVVLPGGPAGGPSTAPGVPAGPEALRIVSLSEWLGEAEVHVRDTTQMKTQRYRKGDALAGGTVAAIDYRPIPMPGNEFLRSDSRVILKIGTNYFAIERGRTLAEKRKLAVDQLPAGLADGK